MNNPQLIQMKKRFAFVTAIVFVIAIMITTIPFNRFILSSTAVVAQQQINSNTSSSQSTNSSSSPSPLSLKTIFKQVENSVVQITSKLPTSNTTTLGSGIVYDKQGHIVTNGHVVGDAKVVDVTFVDGNRYAAKVFF
jgi:S1-C subfamily serine protease